MHILRSVALTTIITAGMASPALAEFPRSGFEGSINGNSAPFVGNWGMKFPEPEGTIFAAEIVSCDSPIRIEAADDIHINYRSPDGNVSTFELKEFEGRTTWFPDPYDTSIAVWVDPDTFNLHATSLGRADWDNPRVMFRCP